LPNRNAVTEVLVTLNAVGVMEVLVVMNAIPQWPSWESDRDRRSQHAGPSSF
jgi:hypothetical protein